MSYIKNVSRGSTKAPLGAGDTVALTRTFLTSSAIPSKDRHAWASRRGTIEHIDRCEGWPLATVRWQDGASPQTIYVGNLCRPRSVAFIEGSAGNPGRRHIRGL